MGKIFGISSLPVSTIVSSLHTMTTVEKPIVSATLLPKAYVAKDTFVNSNRYVKSNTVIKMRNGFGKLMSHFSKVKK